MARHNGTAGLKFPSSMERPVTLSVFIEGTSNAMQPVTTQVALFAGLCHATKLDNQVFRLPSMKPGHYKICFDGCGVTNGFWGVVAAAGLKGQCALVSEYVCAFIKAGLAVNINFLGASRGGIGGLYLAQELSSLDPFYIRLNMLLFDPVPGDFVWISRYLDVFGTSNANQAMDISHVRNLGRVVVLYPHEPLPSIAVHAPLIPVFPEDCNVEWDVLLGCHQGALFLRPSADTCLTFSRIREFLESAGSRISVERGYELSLSDENLADILDRELKHDEPTDRFAHASTTGNEIVRLSQGQFLCRSHQDLLKRLGRRCEVNPQSPIPAYMLDFRKS